MSKVVEEPTVTATESAKPAVGKDAFAAARAQLAAQSTDQGPTEDEAPKPDDTPTQTPTQEPEKVADVSPEPTEPTEDALLSADELAKLSPKERANAEKWQGKLTRRAQELSAKEKDFEQWQPLIDGFKSTPEATLEQVAKQLGFTVTKPAAQDTTLTTDVSAQFSKAIEALPEELRPLFQPFANALANQVLQSVEGRLKPIAEQQTEMITKAAAAETDGEMKAFETKHADFKQHEPAMLQWMQKFHPQAGVTTGEYMEAAYQAVTAHLSKVEQVKETIKQINKSAGSVEPNTPGVSDVRVEQTMPANWNEMTDKERMRAAYDAASKGIIWKK